jgi:hypothetical protein
MAAVGETVALNDHAVVESTTPEATMTMAVDLAMKVAEISTATA